jgi:hypothetical protein
MSPASSSARSDAILQAGRRDVLRRDEVDTRHLVVAVHDHDLAELLTLLHRELDHRRRDDALDELRAVAEADELGGTSCRD